MTLTGSFSAPHEKLAKRACICCDLITNQTSLRQLPNRSFFAALQAEHACATAFPICEHDAYARPEPILRIPRDAIARHSFRGKHRSCIRHSFDVHSGRTLQRLQSCSGNSADLPEPELLRLLSMHEHSALEARLTACRQ